MTPTTEQVAAWVWEAGFKLQHEEWVLRAMLNTFAARAMAEQAEQDAALCDSMQYTGNTPQNCADAIRATSTPPAEWDAR